MLDIIKKELGDALSPNVTPIIQQIANTITANVPDRMKHLVAVSILMYYTSQFRRPAQLLDGTIVPSNFCSVVAAGSGEGKDSSYNMAYKAFAPHFERIQEVNEEALIKDAIYRASKAGEDPADDEAVYSAYKKPLLPTETMFTTAPGVIEMASGVMDMPFGAPLVKTSEMADEYNSNKDTDELIKTIATLYDLGKSPAKVTKGAEFRSKELSGVPLSAILMGSYNLLTEDPSTRKKFINSFTSKLARRSFFVFVNEQLEEPSFSTASEFLEYEEGLDLQAAKAREVLSDLLVASTDYGLSTANNSINVSKDVDRMFKLYKRYNKDYSTQFLSGTSLSALVRQHNQWRALKLATTFAFIDQSNTIEPRHYKAAIQFVESLSEDMGMFDKEIHKSQHEQFADYVQTIVQSDGTAEISIHELKKRGFIVSTAKTKLDELCTLANAYDPHGIYSVNSDASAIHFEKIIKTDSVSISYKEINLAALESATTPDEVANAKQAIAASTVYGYESADTEFSKLSDLLSGAYAYSPFKFKDGTRGKDHILPGTKWLVLDIDDSNITASEAHFLLSDLNHHIALTSDPNNEFKFRVLLELDSVVDLHPLKWKNFYLSIAKDLALKADPLPQSQIFYSYPDRPIYSVTDASPLEVKPYVILAQEQTSKSETKPSSASAKSQLADPLTTFAYAFEAEMGAGSRSMIRAAYHAQDLGATKEEIIQLMHEINEYWATPLDSLRFDNTILAQIERW